LAIIAKLSEVDPGELTFDLDVTVCNLAVDFVVATPAAGFF
jgi:hypothetical protein